MDNISMFYNKHYIRINENNIIVKGFSDAFEKPLDTDICINEKGGYQFRLFPDGEENPCLIDWATGIYKYKYVKGKISERTKRDIKPELDKIDKNKKIESLMLELERIDFRTIRPQRSILAGTGTDDDKKILEELENEAIRIRKEIDELKSM